MAESEDSEILAQLESLIGQRVEYLGHTWQIIEVLDGEAALVLQAEDDARRMLTNAQGDPVRELPDVLELPARDPDTGQVNPEFEKLRFLSNL